MRIAAKKGPKAEKILYQASFFLSFGSSLSTGLISVCSVYCGLSCA